MTPAELERLAILAEECAEVQQMIMKIIRHGYESYNPFDAAKTSNRKLLEKELGDLQFACKMILDNGDVSRNNILIHTNTKSESIKKYLHHNEV